MLAETQRRITCLIGEMALLTLLFVVLFIDISHQQQLTVPPGFKNHTGCLYVYIDKLEYNIRTYEDGQQIGDSMENVWESSSLKLDEHTNCVDENGKGTLGFIFSNDTDSSIVDLKFFMGIKSTPSHGYWEIDRAKMSISFVKPVPGVPTEIELKTTDMYAGSKYSFSCDSLKLQNKIFEKKQPSKETIVYVTLKRFQLQPFQELKHMVFAPSFDCAVWVTVPVWMGLFLTLFMVVGVTIGVYFLQEINTTDLKFSKAGMLLSQAQLEATKG